MKRSTMAILLSTLMAPPVALAQAGNQSAQPAPQGGNQAVQPAAQAGNQTAQRANQAANPSAAQAMDATEFVRRATAGNMFEIQSSQMALDKTKDENLRNFAQRMIDDHTATGERLKEVAGERKVDSTQTDPKHEKMLKELDSASGEEFDRLYIQHQRTAHQEAISLFESYAQNGDDDKLKQFAQNTLPTLREHLKVIEGDGQAQQGQQAQQARSAQAGARQGGQPAGAQALAQQDGSRIVVERDAPKVQVEQASPHITVRQAQPQVSVRQAQPELLVEQPQPTITVDIPQPIITVRMPQPQVDVQVPRPEVQVQQPKPQVQIQESQQPQVQVQAAQPTASVQQREGGTQPNISYAQAEGQPTIRYERAEPKVVINRQEGEPEVRIERMQPGAQGQQSQQAAATQSLQPDQSGQRSQQAQQTQQARQDQQQQRQLQAQQQGAAGANMAAASRAQGDAAQRPGMTNEERERAMTRFGVGSSQEARNRQEAQMREITVGDIEDMDVFNEQGEKLGDVGEVVADQQGQQYVVITEGGFLGIGEDRVALPLERFWVQGDRLVVHGVTEADIEAMDDYRGQSDNYKELDDDTRASVGVWK